jgi:hypothetical protein
MGSRDVWKVDSVGVRKRERELTLAPLENDEQLGDDGGEEEPDVLAHTHGASAGVSARISKTSEGGRWREEASQGRDGPRRRTSTDARSILQPSEGTKQHEAEITRDKERTSGH